MQNKILWEKLNSEQLVKGDFDVEADLDSPWFIKILLAFSGWLAAVFFLFFLGALFYSIFEEPLVLLIVGSVLFALAYFILVSGKNDFLGTNRRFTMFAFFYMISNYFCRCKHPLNNYIRRNSSYSASEISFFQAVLL